MKRLTIILSAIICISTATAEKRDIQIALLADLHIVPGNNNDNIMPEVVADINSYPYDLVVVAGDITNAGSDSELKCAYNHLKKIRHRQIVTHGNHETTWSESGGKNFEKYWGHNGCTTQSVGKYMFIAYPAGPFVKMADGTAQDGHGLRWVEKQLQKAGNKSIISVCHYPLNKDLTNRKQLTTLLNKYGVKASLCGHYHQPQLLNFDSIPGILGRSLMLPHGKQQTYGYTVLTLRGDSIYVAEKLIGKAAVNKYAIRQGRDNTVDSIAPDPQTEELFNGNFNAEQILIDNSEIYTAAQADNGILYFGNAAGEVKAYDINQRQFRWIRRFADPIYSTPILHNGTIVVATLSQGIYALDGATGKTIWRNKDGNTFIGNGLFADGYIYIGTLGKMFKIDASTGKTVWCYTFGTQHPQGRPTIAGDYLVFGSWDCHLFCVNIQSGKEIWRWNNGSNNKLYSPGHVIPRVADGRVMIVAPDRYMTCIELATGRQIWRIKERKVRESTGISADGKVFYAKTMDGEMIAVPMQADNYTELWCADAGWGYDHSFCPLIVSDNTIYMANRRGKVAAVTADGKVVSVGKFADSSANDLRIDSNGDIWVSFIEGVIWKLSACR